MADNERNMPTQDPENLENKIPDSETPIGEVAQPDEPAIHPAEYEAPAVEAENTPAEYEIESAEPVDASDEALEPVAEEPVPEEPIVDEPLAEEPAAEEEHPSDEVDAASATEQTDEPAVEEVAAQEPTAEETAQVEAPADEPASPVIEEIADEVSEDVEDLDGRFEIGVGEDGEIYLIQDGKRYSSSKESDDDDPYDEFEDEEEEEYVDPEDLIIYDEVVEAIKVEGAKLTNTEPALRNYQRHSRDAIQNFEIALKTGNRAFETNRDEKETPVLLVGIIKICGKILEVKCNNLENFVRVKAHDYIKNAKESLHREIERYNEYVITYSSITGEQLTRLSTFLPENIASGKSLAVVPELTYAESYVRILPEELHGREEEKTVMPIIPAVSADDLLAQTKLPRGKVGAFFFTRKIKRAMKKIAKEHARLSKVAADTKALRRKYESELQNLERRTPLAKRATEEYKNQVFEINIKYGKELSGINTLKAKSAFARARQKLTVSRMSIERERLVLAYEHMRAIRIAGGYSQRKAAERMFVQAIESYNRVAAIVSKATGAQFEQLPPSLVERACRGTEIIGYWRSIQFRSQ